MPVATRTTRSSARHAPVNKGKGKAREVSAPSRRRSSRSSGVRFREDSEDKDDKHHIQSSDDDEVTTRTTRSQHANGSTLRPSAPASGGTRRAARPGDDEGPPRIRMSRARMQAMRGRAMRGRPPGRPSLGRASLREPVAGPSTSRRALAVEPSDEDESDTDDNVNASAPITRAQRRQMDASDSDEKPTTRAARSRARLEAMEIDTESEDTAQETDNDVEVVDRRSARSSRDQNGSRSKPTVTFAADSTPSRRRHIATPDSDSDDAQQTRKASDRLRKRPSPNLAEPSSSALGASTDSSIAVVEADDSVEEVAPAPRRPGRPRKGESVPVRRPQSRYKGRPKGAKDTKPRRRRTRRELEADGSGGDSSVSSDSSIQSIRRFRPLKPLKHVEFAMPKLDDKTRQAYDKSFIDLPILPPNDDQTYATQRPRRSHIVYDSDEQMQKSDVEGSDFALSVSDDSSADERDVQAALANGHSVSSDEEEEAPIQEAVSLGEGATAKEIPEPDAPELRHWPTCVCDDGPAHLRLVKLYADKAEIEQEILTEFADGSKKGERRAARAIENNDDLIRINDTILESDHAGAWLRCKRCCSSHHWKCLAGKRQKAILTEYNAVMGARFRATHDEDKKYRPVYSFGADEMIDFALCAECTDEENKACIICSSELSRQNDDSLWFRCKRCRRCFHYACIQQVADDVSVSDTARARQACGWQCIDCDVWGSVEQIIAWRPSADAALNPEPEIAPGDNYPVYNVYADLPREYLVKFQQVSFRDTQWVPHSWLAKVSAMALQNFLRHGARLELEKREVQATRLLQAPVGENGDMSQAVALLGNAEHLHRDIMSSNRRHLHLVANEEGEVEVGPPHPETDAQGRIPRTWRTPDRMLDLFFYATILDGEDDDGANERRRLQRAKDGAAPPTDAHRVEIDSAEKLRRDPNLVHIDDVDPTILIPQNARFIMQDVARCFVKWQDLDYSMCTWESVPERGHDVEAYQAFVTTLRRLLETRRVTLPDRDADEIKALDRSDKIKFKEITDQSKFLKGGTLLDFQLEGLNWLLYSWYVKQPCILADEMGLGKTIQVIGMLGALWYQYSVAPFLVVAPTSTIHNWVRELEKWLPSLRVVPYHGDKVARDVIEQYELFHSAPKEGQHPLKAHIVIMSDFYARNHLQNLQAVERWEVLIVDEGQMLKAGDKSLIYRQLRELDVGHRIIMTGTPLNNNLGELFNLLNFLDPKGQWHDLEALRRKYDVLTPELVEELQPKLRPYFLRRVKKNVVDLPERTEIVVPLSLLPVQKEVYKSLIEKNVADIHALLDADNQGSRAKQRRAVANLNNVLMQLRKTIQHPYLITPDLATLADASATAEEQEHQRLVEASGKLVFLKALLPKLKARGHRVLLFSQFAIVLDILESFMTSEGYEYLRIDGGVGSVQRQSNIDEFNSPDSEQFVFLLTTRAGGFGINLATADTVIIFDPDFNPFADQQAVARAHRIGQTKHVLVFQLMCKLTAEQRIVEMARRKLVIDHLIVQNLDLERSSRPEEMENIIKFGAQALFEEGGLGESNTDVRYSDQDIDDLILRAETAASKVEEIDGVEDVGSKLEFPSVFKRDAERESAIQAQQSADDGAEPDVADEEQMNVASENFWESLLQKRFERADDDDDDIVEKRARNAPLHTLHSAAGIDLEAKKKRKRRKVKYAQEDEQPEGDDLLKSLIGSFRVAHDPDFVPDGFADDGSEEAVEDMINAKEGVPGKRRRGRPRGSKTGRAQSKYVAAADDAIKVLEQIPVDLMKDVLDRKGAPPGALPAEQKPQLTEKHCQYFVQKLGFPRKLFDHAFVLVSPDLLPESVKAMEYEGASMLSEQVVTENLKHAAHYLYGVWRTNWKRVVQQEERKARKNGSAPMLSPLARLARLDELIAASLNRLPTGEEKTEILNILQSTRNDRLVLAAIVASNEKDAGKLRDLLGRIRSVFQGQMQNVNEAARAAAAAIEKRYNDTQAQAAESSSAAAARAQPAAPAVSLPPSTPPSNDSGSTRASAAPSQSGELTAEQRNVQKRLARNEYQREYQRRKKAERDAERGAQAASAMAASTAASAPPPPARVAPAPAPIPQPPANQPRASSGAGSLSTAGVVEEQQQARTRPRARPRARASAVDEQQAATSSMNHETHEPFNRQEAMNRSRQAAAPRAQPSSRPPAFVDQRSMPPAMEPQSVHQQHWRSPAAAASAQVKQWNARPFEPTSTSGLSAPSPSASGAGYHTTDMRAAPINSRYSSTSAMGTAPRTRTSTGSHMMPQYTGRGQDIYDGGYHHGSMHQPEPSAPPAVPESGGKEDDTARCLICWATPFHYMTTCPLVRDADATLQRYTNLRNLYLSTPSGQALRNSGGDPREAESNDQWRQELQVVLMFMYMNLTQRGIQGLAAVPM